MSEIKNKDISTRESNSAYTHKLDILRKRENLTQEEFAEKVGISAVLVSNMEKQVKKLSLTNAMEIAKQFNVSLDWLYGLSEDAKDSASNILVTLKDIFDIDLEQKCLKIDSNLATFLEELSNAYRIKSKKANNVSDDAFKFWIEGIKKSYNEKPKSDDITYYYLQSKDEYLGKIEEKRMKS